MTTPEVNHSLAVPASPRKRPNKELPSPPKKARRSLSYSEGLLHPTELHRRMEKCTILNKKSQVGWNCECSGCIREQIARLEDETKYAFNQLHYFNILDSLDVCREKLKSKSNHKCIKA